MFDRLMGWYTIYILGALAPERNSASCKIHFASKSCVILYWQRPCTALEQRASARLRRGTRNRITALSAFFSLHVIFTLGIGPHSSSVSVCLFSVYSV